MAWSAAFRSGPEGPVHALEGVDRLLALGAGVVGHRVVARVVDVDDRRAAVHLLDDQGGRDRAQADVGHGPLDGVVQSRCMRGWTSRPR